MTEAFCDEMESSGRLRGGGRGAGCPRRSAVRDANFSRLPTASWNTGDVHARAYVRWMEIEHSITFIRDQLHAFLGGGLKAAGSNRLGGVVLAMPPQRLAALVEGWRGEICHVAVGPTPRAGWRVIKWWTRQPTTGRGWRLRCATSRSRIFRSATRA